MSNNLQKDYEIVVAHYGEDLEWLKPYAKDAIVYHKWKEDKPRFECKKWIKINNVWREGHTYLYHIVNNYDNLPEYTFFFQWWIEKMTFLQMTITYARIRFMLWLGHSDEGVCNNEQQSFFKKNNHYCRGCGADLCRADRIWSIWDAVRETRHQGYWERLGRRHRASSHGIWY